MSTTELTQTQRLILDAAIQHTGGRIERFPDNIKGGARSKVLDGLFNRALITRDGDGWCVAAEGYDAMNHPRPGINPKRISAFEANLDRIIANAEAATAEMEVSTSTPSAASSKHEMKLTTKPSLAIPATTAMIPMQMASAAVVWAKAPLSPATMPPTTAAESAAAAALAPVIRFREVPIAA